MDVRYAGFAKPVGVAEGVRASVFHSGRSENPKVVGSNPALTFVNPGTNDFKIDTYHSLAWRLTLLG